jgi:hypothetical protein
VKRQADLLCREIPDGYLLGLVERQAVAPLISSPRTVNPMGKGEGLLTDDAGPDFIGKGPLDLLLGRQGIEQGLDEAEAALAAIGNELQGCHIDAVAAHLAVADYAVARELESCYAILSQTHVF